MNIIAFIVLGGIVGWLAARLMGRDEGVLGSIAIGILGSIIGGFLSVFITGSQSYLSLGLSDLLWSLVGAVILVALLNTISRPHRV